MNPIDDFEAAIGLVFRDKSLLLRALTHRSFLNEYPEFPIADNERLEFLGDAVLDFLVGEFVYHRFPEMREGDLTNLRAALVRREALADFAMQMELGRFLRMGRGEVESGGRERSATLCAAFEALVGALYLDQGLERVRDFVLPFIEPELARVQEEALEKDPKSRLQEWSQAELHATPHYRTVAERGPDHAKEFTVEVTIGGEPYGLGVGHSKQAAAQAAAAAALERLAAAGKLEVSVVPAEEQENGDGQSSVR
ncbi:MAG: ribonuclease III [Anaerolineae bacterium]|nr:ribonuclease III [Anaerolineae bacterium]